MIYLPSFSSGLSASGFDFFQLRPRPINLFHNVLDLCGPNKGLRLEIPLLQKICNRLLVVRLTHETASPNGFLSQLEPVGIK